MERHRPQRNWGPRLREGTYQGMRHVTLENERLRVSVLAGKGSGIVELLDKRSDLDLVWLTPGGVQDPTDSLSTSPDPLATFIDSYPGSWQEIFPNGGAPSTYAGASFGQHGEVANLPWDTRIVEDSEAAVVICGRSAAAVEAAVSDLRAGGLTVEGASADVGRDPDVERLVALAVARFGGRGLGRDAGD